MSEGGGNVWLISFGVLLWVLVLAFIGAFIAEGMGDE